MAAVVCLPLDGVDPTRVDEGLDCLGLEADISADLAERDSPLGDKPPHKTRRHAENLGDLIDAEQRLSHVPLGTRGHAWGYIFT